MRDFFALLVIALAVVSLGIFRMPEEDAVIAAGIRAAAQTAMADQVHPVTLEVEGRRITVTGRVESRGAANAVLRELRGLDGVESVVDKLTILPDADPFELRLQSGEDGVTASGFVPRRSLAQNFGEILGMAPGDGLPGLSVATGVPDAQWDEVAERAVTALARLERGQLSITGREVQLAGAALVPRIAREVEAELADLPEGYGVTLDLQVLDDGTPYRLVLSRDPRMGLRLQGKLPPGTDLGALTTGLGRVQESAVEIAAVARPAPGFDDALRLGLGLFAGLDVGNLAVTGAETGGSLTLSGGPLAPAEIAERVARAAPLPPGYAVHLPLVPQDDGAPLEARAVLADGRVLLTGKLPADVTAEALQAALGAVPLEVSVQRSPYPDLAGWGAALPAGLQALGQLAEGQVTLDDGGLRLTGVADLPDARNAALRALGGAGTFDVLLKDDGKPPRFTLSFTARNGADLAGKLPGGLSPQDLADALGLGGLRGAAKRSPAGEPDALLARLVAIAPWLGQVEDLALEYDDGQLTVSATPSPGMSALRIAAAMDGVLERADRLDLQPGLAPPLVGTRRVHAASGQAQIFVAGHWLDDLAFSPTVESCTGLLARATAPEFAAGSLRMEIGANAALAHLAALARACDRFAGLTLEIEGHAASADVDVLNRQLSRRRAEAVRAALVDRGVPAEALRAAGVGDTQGIGDVLRFGFSER